MQLLVSSRVLRIANSTMQCHFDSYSRGRGQDREPITFDQERESMEEFKHSHIYANFASQEKMGDVYVIGLAFSSIVVLGANSRDRSALRRGCTYSKSTIFSTTHESSPMPVCSQHYTTTNRTKCISTFARHPAITDCNEPHIATIHQRFARDRNICVPISCSSIFRPMPQCGTPFLEQTSEREISMIDFGFGMERISATQCSVLWVRGAVEYSGDTRVCQRHGTPEWFDRSISKSDQCGEERCVCVGRHIVHETGLSCNVEIVTRAKIGYCIVGVGVGIVATHGLLA